MLDRVPPPYGVSAAGGNPSPGAVVLSNSNGISFGQNASTVTASYTVPTVTAGSDTFGVSNLGNTAGTSGVVSGDSVALYLAGGNNVTLSQSKDAGNRSATVTISAANQSVQTQNCVDVTVGGNTAGTLALVSSGTLTLAGGNNITLSQVGNAVTVVGGAGGGFSAGVSTGGNTQGNTGVTGTRLVLVGNPNITLSQNTDANGATITFSGGAGAAGNTGFISAGAATASLGTVVLSNSNGVSFGVNGQTVTASVASQSAIKAFGASNTGNTAGNTGVSTGVDWVLAASNGLTISESTAVGGPNTLWAQVGAYLTTADLSANSSNYLRNWKLTGNTAGTTSSAQGTDLWLAGGNGVTLSGSSNSITFSVATNYQSQGAYLTTAALSGDTSKYVQNWKLTGNTAGTTSSAQGTDFWLAGGNGITVSGSSNTISLSVGNYLTTADLSANSSNYVRNWKLTGNTAGTTSSAQGTDLWLAGGNGVTLSGSSNTISVSVATNYQSQGAYLTTAALSGDTSKYFQNWKLAGNTAGTTSSAEGTDFWLAGGNNVTVSGSSNTISISVGNYITTADLSQNSSNYARNWKLTGNTAGTTSSAIGTDLWIAGGNNITVSGNSNSITISAGNAAPSPVNFSAGTTSNNLGSVVFSNSNGVSFGLNGSTITASVSAAGGGFSAGVSTMGNTAGSTGLSGSNLYLVGTGAVSLSQSTDSGGLTVSIAAPATSSLSATGNVSIVTTGSTISIGAGNTVSQWDHPGSFSIITNSTLGQNTLYFAPIDIYNYLSAYRINFFFSVATTMSAGNSTGRGGYTFSAALYQRDTGTNSTQMTSFWSGSAGLAATQNSNTQLVATNLAGIQNSTSVATVATSLSTSNATTYMANSIAGFRVVPLPISSTLPPGDYWLAVANSSSSSNAGVCVINCSVMQHTIGGNIAFRPFGTSSAAGNASFYNAREGLGTFSATSGGFPGTIPLNSDSIRGASAMTIPLFNFSAYTTATNML